MKMIPVGKAHGRYLEKLSELNGVKRESIWEPEWSLGGRVIECWKRLGTHGTMRPSAPHATVWWAPLEWIWWRIWR
jgi:hypothetical protein